MQLYQPLSHTYSQHNAQQTHAQSIQPKPQLRPPLKAYHLQQPQLKSHRPSSSLSSFIVPSAPPPPESSSTFLDPPPPSTFLTHRDIYSIPKRSSIHTLRTSTEYLTQRRSSGDAGVSTIYNNAAALQIMPNTSFADVHNKSTSFHQEHIVSHHSTSSSLDQSIQLLRQRSMSNATIQIMTTTPATTTTQYQQQQQNQLQALQQQQQVFVKPLTQTTQAQQINPRMNIQPSQPVVGKQNGFEIKSIMQALQFDILAPTHRNRLISFDGQLAPAARTTILPTQQHSIITSKLPESKEQFQKQNNNNNNNNSNRNNSTCLSGDLEVHLVNQVGAPIAQMNGRIDTESSLQTDIEAYPTQVEVSFQRELPVEEVENSEKGREEQEYQKNQQIKSDLVLSQKEFRQSQLNMNFSRNTSILTTNNPTTISHAPSTAVIPTINSQNSYYLQSNSRDQLIHKESLMPTAPYSSERTSHQNSIRRSLENIHNIVSTSQQPLPSTYRNTNSATTNGFYQERLIESESKGQFNQKSESQQQTYYHQQANHNNNLSNKLLLHQTYSTNSKFDHTSDNASQHAQQNRSVHVSPFIISQSYFDNNMKAIRRPLEDCSNTMQSTNNTNGTKETNKTESVQSQITEQSIISSVNESLIVQKCNIINNSHGKQASSLRRVSSAAAAATVGTNNNISGGSKAEIRISQFEVSHQKESSIHRYNREIDSIRNNNITVVPFEGLNEQSNSNVIIFAPAATSNREEYEEEEEQGQEEEEESHEGGGGRESANNQTQKIMPISHSASINVFEKVQKKCGTNNRISTESDSNNSEEEDDDIHNGSSGFIPLEESIVNHVINDSTLQLSMSNVYTGGSLFNSQFALRKQVDSLESYARAITNTMPKGNQESKAYISEIVPEKKQSTTTVVNFNRASHFSNQGLQGVEEISQTTNSFVGIDAERVEEFADGLYLQLNIERSLLQLKAGLNTRIAELLEIIPRAFETIPEFRVRVNRLLSLRFSDSDMRMILYSRQSGQEMYLQNQNQIDNDAIGIGSGQDFLGVLIGVEKSTMISSKNSMSAKPIAEETIKIVRNVFKETLRAERVLHEFRVKFTREEKVQILNLLHQSQIISSKNVHPFLGGGDEQNNFEYVSCTGFKHFLQDNGYQVREHEMMLLISRFSKRNTIKLSNLDFLR